MRDGKSLDQVIPEVTSAFWTIQLSKVGEFVFLSFYSKKVLILGCSSKGNTSIREGWKTPPTIPSSPSLSWLEPALHSDPRIGPLPLSHSPRPSSLLTYPGSSEQCSQPFSHHGKHRKCQSLKDTLGETKV